MDIFLSRNVEARGMSTHGLQEGTGTETGTGTDTTAAVSLPDAVPLELPHLSRLRWDLGSRVVEDDDVTVHSEWERTGGSWALSIFRVTEQTVVVRVQTPVGRERFYGAVEQDIDASLSALESATRWERLE